MKNINDKIFLDNENVVIDFSKKKIINFINNLPNFKLFYKLPNKKNFDTQEESEEKELLSLIILKKTIYYENYDDFLKSFYSDEEYKIYKGKDCF